jgi:hypothetical protein
MSLYAQVDSNNFVTNIIVCEDSNISIFSGNFIKVTDSTKNASVGYSWDIENNKFLKPKPFDSWSLDENFEWVSPSGESFLLGHYWNEDSQEWVQALNTEE